MERNIEDLKKEFENFKMEDNCIDGSCASDEQEDLKDYPDYTQALYAKLMPPSKSGVYISRWDIKDIALEAGDSMAIHPRKRMFELLMKYAVSKENMTLVLEAMEKHINEKIAIYEEMMENFPSSKEVFEPQIAKANKTIALLPTILDEYFV
ncbi:MAG: hypothetical protein U9N49_05360 [Campylobacterota bacterium]|nr:hypothetical protein [Campylobacterota bacterium]